MIGIEFGFNLAKKFPRTSSIFQIHFFFFSGKTMKTGNAYLNKKEREFLFKEI